MTHRKRKLAAAVSVKTSTHWYFMPLRFNRFLCPTEQFFFCYLKSFETQSNRTIRDSLAKCKIVEGRCKSVNYKMFTLREEAQLIFKGRQLQTKIIQLESHTLKTHFSKPHVKLKNLLQDSFRKHAKVSTVFCNTKKYV